MDTTLAVAIRSDERWNVFGDCSRRLYYGTAIVVVLKRWRRSQTDDFVIPSIPKVEREDSVILPQEQL